MRQIYYILIVVAAIITAFCCGFIYSLQYVHYDEIHNIDVDGSRGRAIIEASRKAAEREDLYAESFDDDFRTIWSGEVVKVNDGDTIAVYKRGDKRNERIRLWGVDAPEKGQEYGEEAKKYLKSLVSGKRVDVIEIGDRDRYGRVVAVIEVDGVAINGKLIEAGLTWVYPRYCKGQFKAELMRLEGEAREGRRGLWARDGAVVPWEWRINKLNRDRR